LIVALLMPAMSPSDSSSSVALKPLRSAYFRYWRSSIEAQSQASVPPAPAWMSRKQLLGSAGLLNMRRNSRPSTISASFAASASMACRPATSPSALAISYSSVLSARLPVRWSMVWTTSSSVRFSRPSSCARFGSSQTLGFSSAALTSFSRSDLRS